MPEAPRDAPLQELLQRLAGQSGGNLQFRVSTSTELARERGIELTRSPNPLYVFEWSTSSGKQTAVAYTLALAGGTRPATRAEALGRSLAASNGQLFDLNPCLFVYDYSGSRLLAVSAIELFDAFADHSEANEIPYSGTSSFSLSPHFVHGTISMYAELRSPVVWAAPVSSEALTLGKLTDFLDRVSQRTRQMGGERQKIVTAIRARLAATPTGALQIRVGDSRPAGQRLDLAGVELTDEAVRVDDRLWQIILTAIASSTSVILVGPPGTGKSALLRKAVGAISDQRQTDGLEGIRQPLWATPDESWTSRDLIGGETVVNGEIVFQPGWVLRAIAEDRWLVLDEANRGDLDRIFGALLTWLAGGVVTVGVESSAIDAKVIELTWTDGPSRVEVLEADGSQQPGKVRYLASTNEWKLLGTYNAVDAQRVFRLGAALGRRFLRVPIPPLEPTAFESTLRAQAADLNEMLLWRIAALYSAHFSEEATRLGPAHFLGMCPYLRVAMTMRDRVVNSDSVEKVDLQWRTADYVASTPSAARTAVLGVGRESGSAGETGAEEHFDEPPKQTGRDPSTPFFDMILSEAYVLSLGTSLAQLETPDLEELAHRVRESNALSSEDLGWVLEMTKSLA